ncbi:MAG: hypothetical protein FJ386_12060 [Verrucomicrobia bacterium]|nr:hypothetical protein [Verrucomicrobiota bacterium]
MTRPTDSHTGAWKRDLTRAFWSAVGLAFLVAPGPGLAQDKLATKLLQGRKPKPVNPDTEPPRDPAALKFRQEITSGPAPLDPAEFSPDFGSRLFLSPAFAVPDPKLELRVSTNRSRALPPSVFNPDLSPSPALPPWIRDAQTLRAQSQRTTAVPPAPPAQFNPDPGAGKGTTSPTQSQPFFRTEPWTAPRPFGSEPLPHALELPRMRVRVGDFVLEPEPPPTGFGFDPVPRGLAPPRAQSRRNDFTLSLDAPPPRYGLEPLAGELTLPRPNTRRNLRIDDQLHPHDYASPGDYQNPPASEPRPDRWRVPFAQWKRYPKSGVESPLFYDKPALWHPYRQSLLKGDLPVIGDDIFLNVTATSLTDFEARTVPTPSGVSAAQPGAAEFFGRSEAMSVSHNLSFSFELFKGETVFKPVEWALRVTPVYNLNYLHAQETGVVSPDPRGAIGGANPALNQPPPSNAGIQNPLDLDTLLTGQVAPVSDDLAGRRHTVRTRDFFALQEYFAELHLGDLSDNYDFWAVRLGNQFFNSDFRGFIFNDVNFGLRFFGNRDNNRWQYNVAGFDTREKDTNSELNTFNARNQQLLIANLYRQDFLVHGYTAQWSLHLNQDEGTIQYDRNGNIVRPAPIGAVRPHDVRAYYFGWGGDGHVGRWNISHQFYHVIGDEGFNGIAGRPVDINAQMAAVELSYDRDWLRYKGTFFWASGDGNADDQHATGFDTIIDNPNFFGGPFSYWVRQGFNLAGSAVSLKQRSSLVPNLRTSKTQGQANFVNPGVFIYGLGLEAEITPKLRGFFNANYIQLAEPDPIQTVLLTDKIGREMGFDLSLGFVYRPLLTENIILTTGFGSLIPGRGYRDIFRRNTDPVANLDQAGKAGRVDSLLYSGIITLTFTY